MSEKLLNLDFINNATFGDNQLKQELLNLFIQQASALPNDLRQPFLSANFDALARNAHKFRSTALSLGMSPLADALKKIEVLSNFFYLNSPNCNKDDNAKSLYLSQINGLTPELNNWAKENMTLKSVQQLIDFCKLQCEKAITEARDVLNAL